MENKMEFHRNASVLGANREQFGHLERVVLETESRNLTHLVVRTGGLLSREDKLVPVGLVAQASPEEIVLSAEAEDPETWPAFEEARVVAVAEEEPDFTPTQAGSTPAVYGAPIVGAPLPRGPAERYETRTEQNIPQGTVALKGGAKVLTAEGKAVGSLEGVFAQAADFHVVHLLVSSGLIAKERKLLPVDWVEGITDDEIQLRLGPEKAFESLGSIQGG